MYKQVDALYDATIERVGFVVALIALIIVTIGLMVYLFGRFNLFKKCGKEGWLAIVPFYSDYIFYTQICGLHWGWFAASMLINLISIKESYVTFLRIFVNGMAFYNLAIKCDRDKIAAMIFGGIVPSILTVIYGFSSLNYDETKEVKQSGLF